jgi:CMP-N,N'-diacetyllegionaminic acid synthase
MSESPQKIVLGLIAAREGSKGIPNKNILKIAGKELVRHAAEVGKDVEEIDLLICSTDGKKIAEIASDSGVEVPFMRPKELAQDSTPMLPVMRHAINEIEKKHNCLVECVVILDPTSPMRTAQDVRNAIEFYKSNDVDLVVSVHRGHYNPYFNMLEKQEGYFKLPLGAEENYGSRQAAPAVYQINTVVWIYSRASIFEERVRIPKKTLIYEFPEDRSMDLDTPDDIKRLNYFLSEAKN